jgi:hypothetical protein
MPWYKFALAEQNAPLEQDPGWFASDVEALFEASQVAFELRRNRNSQDLGLVRIVRLPRPLPETAPK